MACNDHNHIFSIFRRLYFAPIVLDALLAGTSITLSNIIILCTIWHQKSEWWWFPLKRKYREPQLYLYSEISGRKAWVGGGGGRESWASGVVQSCRKLLE